MFELTPEKFIKDNGQCGQCVIDTTKIALWNILTWQEWHGEDVTNPYNDFCYYTGMEKKHWKSFLDDETLDITVKLLSLPNCWNDGKTIIKKLCPRWCEKMRDKNVGMPNISVRLPDDLKSYRDTNLVELLAKCRKLLADEKNRQKSYAIHDIRQLV